MSYKKLNNNHKKIKSIELNTKNNIYRHNRFIMFYVEH